MVRIHMEGSIILYNLWKNEGIPIFLQTMVIRNSLDLLELNNTLKKYFGNFTFIIFNIVNCLQRVQTYGNDWLLRWIVYTNESSLNVSKIINNFVFKYRMLRNFHKMDFPPENLKRNGVIILTVVIKPPPKKISFPQESVKQLEICPHCKQMWVFRYFLQLLIARWGSCLEVL